MKPKKHNINLTEAASLKYDPVNDGAPQITASGKGFVAEKIIETARAAGVPVYRDKALAETLNRLSVGEMIPIELYDVVSEVLAFVLGVDKKQEIYRAASGNNTFE
jgi:flagellar biosynthesis protein